MKTCPHCGIEYPDETSVCAVDQTPLGLATAAAAGSRSPVCPACGEREGVEPVVSPRGSFSLPVFLFGGLLAVLVHNASRPKRVRCVRCNTVFSYRPPVSRASRVILWMLFVPTVICLIILLIRLATLFFARG